MRKQLRFAISLIGWGLVCIVVLVGVALLSVKTLLPYLNDYRSQIESNLSQLTGYHVTISSLDGRLEGIDPTVSVNDLKLSIHGNVAASVSEIRVRLNALKTLLTLSPQFTYVRFVDPAATLQERDGRVLLKGAVVSSDTEVEGDVGFDRVLGYLVAQQRLSVLNAKITLNSGHYGSHSISIPEAYIFQQAQSSWIKSKVYVDANAVPFSINAKIYQSLGVFGAYQIDADMNVPNLSIPLSGHLPSWSSSLKNVDFAGKLWLNYRVGEGFLLQSKVSKLSVAFDNGETYQAAPDVRVRFGEKSVGLLVDVNNLTLRDQSNKAYPTANLSYEWASGTGKSYLRLDQFDLALADKISRHFLAPEWQVTHLITGLSPTGMISNVALRLGVDKSGVNYQFLSNLENASVAGYNGIPKANHVDGVLGLNNGDGYIQFKGKNTQLAFPTLYSHSWDVDALSGTVDWQQQQDAFVVTGKDLAIKRHGSDVQGSFRFEAREKAPDWLSISLRGQHIPVSDRLTYIPDNTLDAGLSDWLKSAFMGKGEVNNVNLVVQTELAKEASPDIRLSMDVKDADIRFDPGWPTAQSVNGQFQLDQSGVHVDVKNAQLSDLAVSNIKVDVPMQNGSADWLNVKGQIADDSAKIFSLLQSTPLSESVLSTFKTWRISGNVDGQFDVSVPLNDKHNQPKVALDLSFKDNPTYVGDIGLNSVIDSGQLHYSSEKGIHDSTFDIDTLSGKSHLVLTSSVQKNGELAVLGHFSGTGDLHELAKWQEWPSLVSKNLSGVTGYKGDFAINKVRNGQVDLTIESDLKGAALSLPEPFTKDAPSSVPFSLQLGAYQGDVSIKTTYGKLAKTQLLIRSGDFWGGEFLFNSSKALSKTMPKGLVLDGQFSSFKLSQWQDVFAQPQSQNDSSATGISSLLAIPKWLSGVDVLIDHVVVNPENTLHNVKLTYNNKLASPKLELNSDEMNFLFDHQGAKPRLHFGYLSWNTKKDAAKGSPDKPPFHVSQIPELDLQIDQLVINQKPFGDWALSVPKHGNQLVTIPFSSKLKKGSFDGKLVWKDEGKNSTVNLTLIIKGEDLAELTGKFSKKAFVTSKNFDINVALNWKGHPLYFDRPTLNGSIVFSAKDGNFSQVDELPPFLKIFGIFNVDALRRRLSLDFSDVYKPGLTYDTFEGDFSIKNGMLTTVKPLHVVSPTAEVTLEGKADLVNEQLDEKLTATLPITRSLPLAGLLWGTPQLAGILYLTDKLIGNTLSKVTSVQYTIEGPFDHPVVTPVQHKPIKRVEH